VRDTNGVEQKPYIGEPSSHSRPPDPCLIIAGSAFGHGRHEFRVPVLFQYSNRSCVIDSPFTPPDEEAVKIPVVIFRVPAALDGERARA